MGVSCDEEIITGVDKLLHLVNEKQTLSLSDAANELGVDKGIVEEWTDMLEQDDLISVKMNLWEQHLVSNDWQDDGVGVFQMLRMALTPKSRFNENELKERCKDLRKREFKVATQLRTINTRLKELKRYERLKRRAQEAMQEATQERRRISAAHDKLAKERKFIDERMHKLDERSAELDQRAADMDARLADIDACEQAVNQREQRVHKMRKDVENVLSDVPKMVDDLIEQRIRDD